MLLYKKICCDLLLELSHGGSFNEGSQHMFSLRINPVAVTKDKTP